MAASQKLGVERIKNRLVVDVHYLKMKTSQNTNVFVEVTRSKNSKKETAMVVLDSNNPLVNFEHQAVFEVKMQKKGKKYEKKFFSVKVIQVKGVEMNENGRVKIDFSQIPALKKPIVKREVPLQHCSDKAAIICISVSLEAILTKNSGKNVRDSKNKEEILKEGEEDEGESELNSSMMSFSDFIIHPKDSELESESSSSEEEYKELPPERLVAHAVPKTTYETARPNENSKSLQIDEMEVQAGISTTRESGTCGGCETF